MKKVIALLTVVCVLLCAIPACAEPAAELITEVNMVTLGQIIDWDMNIDDVAEILDVLEANAYEETDDTYGLTLNMEGETETTYYFYCYYFNNLSRKIRAAEGSVVLMNADDFEPLVQALNEAYGLEELEEYESDFVNDYISKFEKSFACANEDTIFMLCANPENDESYTVVDFLLLDRAYYEN